MKRYLFLWIVIMLGVVTASAQKIAKPTLTAKQDTTAQRQLIDEGAKLHDQKQYDAAIKKYEQVLTENADSTLAMYELAMTLYTKGEKEKAMEMAVRGSKYRSPELPLFYMTIANVIDDIGKPDEAIKIYLNAIKFLREDRDSGVQLASVHFNLGVTYVKQKKYTEARETLKKAVEYNNAYSSPHYLLALVFNGTKYKIPAFLAAARFVSLEPNSGRTSPTAAIIKSTLEPAKKDEKTGNINIFIDMNSPTDEGDFAMYDLFLGTMTTVKGDKDKNKSEEEVFADSIESVIALLEENKKLRSTFVGKNYIPFVVEMKVRGHSRVFSYLVLHKSGNQKATGWLTENSAKLKDFLEWAKIYRPPTN